MRLVDLHPELFDSGGPGVITADGSPVPLRKGTMLWFDCPKCDPATSARHGGIGCRLNPAMDGSPCTEPHPWWSRTGDTFETMSLQPSIHNITCGAHFYITNGEVVWVP